MRGFLSGCRRARAGGLCVCSGCARAEPEYVPGELIVPFNAGSGPTRRAEILRENGARRKRTMRLPGAEVVSLARGKSVEAAARELEAQPVVLFAEPNYIYRPMATPNDPRFGALWGLQQATDRDIEAPEAWGQQTGSAAIKVAIVDTGVAYDHPDLAANMLAGYDFFDDDPDPRDDHGHGTHDRRGREQRHRCNGRELGRFAAPRTRARP
jgi:thermitase